MKDQRPENLFPPGTALHNRFCMKAKLGSGASGAVYRDYDQELQTELALKVLHPKLIQDSLLVSSFVNEFRLLAELAHPNIVSVSELFEDSPHDVVCFTLECIEGQSLLSLAGTLSLTELAPLLLEIARGLEYAHSRGVLHRDVKPSNILISPGCQSAQIIDFGTSLLLEDSRINSSRLGSPAYMAPEYIVHGKASIGSDIYAFGVHAVEAMTGRRPFDAKSMLSLSAAHLLSPLPGDLWQHTQLPKWFVTLVEICLEKNPAHRFQSFSEIVNFLEDSIEQARQSVNKKKTSRFWSSLKRFFSLSF